jgi:DNA-binding Xre family transcriptional regulator
MRAFCRSRHVIAIPAGEGRAVTIDMLARLAVALDVGMDDLLEGITVDPSIVELRPRV